MRSILLPCFVVLTGAALSFGEPAEEKPHWHADWATAQRIAKKANKPIFAVFVCKH